MSLSLSRGRYSLGIDLHKQFAYWTLIDSERNSLWKGKVLTNEEATVQAIAKLPVVASSIQAAIEPVEQWGWYADVLETNGVKVKLVDTLKSKLIAQSRLKNDKVDSSILAELLRSDFLPESYLAPIETRELREFLRFRCFIVRLRSRIKNRIHGILAKHGLSAPKSDLFGKAGMLWLREQELRPVFKKELGSLLNIFDSLQKEILEADKEVRARAKATEELLILGSVPGVGSITALTIKAEVGDFSRFHNPEKFASHAGLCPSSRSSAGKQHFGRITKQGSPYLRWVLVEAVQRVNPKWGRLYFFFEEIKKKKGVKIARVALARKLLTICYFLVKRKERFVPQGLGALSSLEDRGGVKNEVTL